MVDCMRSQFQTGTSPVNPSKHKCLMARTSEITIASEYCTIERPCVMNLDKMSLHYVIHYIKRGVWDKVVPEPVEDDKPRIDGYQCNICEKKFRNNHSKEEYPARGSFICHFATEHGKVVDAMRNDDEVDMKPVLDILDKSDDRLGKFVRDGTETAHDNDPVKVVESISWRIQQNGFNINVPTSQKQKKNVKNVIKCPKCKDFDKNRDPNNLKLHIFHHYLDFWDEKVAKMTKKETVCDKCSPIKRIVGANPEGCRTALICHRAIQHDELRTVLENDKELPDGFIDDLFGDVSVKPVKGMQAGKSNNKPDEDPNQTKSEQEIHEERERITQESKKSEMMRIAEKRKEEEIVKKELPDEDLFSDVSVEPVKIMHVGKSNDKPDEDPYQIKSEPEIHEEREIIAQEVRKREMMRIVEKRKEEEKVNVAKDGKGIKRKRKEETKRERDERTKKKMLELQKILEEKTKYWNNRNL